MRPDGPYGGVRGVGGRGSRWWPQTRQPQNRRGMACMVMLRVGQPRPTIPRTEQSGGPEVEMRQEMKVEKVDDLLLDFVSMKVEPGQE